MGVCPASNRGEETPRRGQRPTRGTILALTAAAYDLTFGAPTWLSPFHGLGGLAGFLAIGVVFWIEDSSRDKGRLMGIQISG